MLAASDDTDDLQGFGLNLTALLDVMSNLLFFLLLSFAAQTSSMDAEQGLLLPNSSTEQPLRPSIALRLSQKVLQVDEAVVAQLQGGQVVGAPSGRIEALYQHLLRRRAALPAAGATAAAVPADPAEPADAAVLVVYCDAATPYPLLHQVLDTAAAAGFARFRMVTLVS